MLTPQLQPQTIQEYPSQHGLCFGLVDDHDYVFLVLADEDYSRSTLRLILNSLKSEFYKYNPNAMKTLIDSKSVNTRFIQELGLKYSKSRDEAKTGEAQVKLNEVQLQMQNNMRMMMGNTEEMKVFIISS